MSEVKFTTNAIEKMLFILENPNPRGDGNTTNKDHVTHCLHQLIRFANLARQGHKFRFMQFGLNLGRAQEILESYGGVGCWWRVFENLIETEDFAGIIKVTFQYLAVLKLEPPTEEFINRQ